MIAVITDLFFQSRVAAAARACNREVSYAASLEDLANVEGYSVALVDLDAAVDVTRAISMLAGARSGPIIAFGPHVDTAGRKAARAAGAHRVLAKSKFVSDLPSLMGERQAVP